MKETATLKQQDPLRQTSSASPALPGTKLEDLKELVDQSFGGIQDNPIAASQNASGDIPHLGEESKIDLLLNKSTESPLLLVYQKCWPSHLHRTTLVAK